MSETKSEEKKSDGIVQKREIEIRIDGFDLGRSFDEIIESLFSFDDKINLIITYGRGFNLKLPNLPQSVSHLIFGDEFDQEVDNLPRNITHLFFGRNFNRKVDNLPTTLTHLTFGDQFDQEVDNLPISITHLTFGRNFNTERPKWPKRSASSSRLISPRICRSP